MLRSIDVASHAETALDGKQHLLDGPQRAAIP
jgi:hypothetical protein